MSIKEQTKSIAIQQIKLFDLIKEQTKSIATEQIERLQSIKEQTKSIATEQIERLEKLISKINKEEVNKDYLIKSLNNEIISLSKIENIVNKL